MTEKRSIKWKHNNNNNNMDENMGENIEQEFIPSSSPILHP
jgi:hypothetical protein